MHKDYKLLKKICVLNVKIDKMKKSNVIYKIPCNNYERVYIGQTNQFLKNKLISRKYNKKNKTSVTNNCKGKYNFFFEGTKI